MAVAVAGSFAFLTTEANSLVRPLHDRMPVILPPEHLERWLDPENDDLDELMDLLRPFPAKQMRHVEVSTRVNYVTLTTRSVWNR